MRRPPLPATTSPMYACRPEWNRTAFATWPGSSFISGPFPGTDDEGPPVGVGWEPFGVVPGRRFRAKSEAEYGNDR
jgi:hypothetical protein